MPKTKALREAYERLNACGAREFIAKLGAREMECTQDAAGIVWARYVLPNGRSFVLFATPHMWDFFTPAHESTKISATFDAIEQFAAKPARCAL